MSHHPPTSLPFACAVFGALLVGCTADATPSADATASEVPATAPVATRTLASQATLPAADETEAGPAIVVHRWNTRLTSLCITTHIEAEWRRSAIDTPDNVVERLSGDGQRRVAHWLEDRFADAGFEVGSPDCEARLVLDIDAQPFASSYQGIGRLWLGVELEGWARMEHLGSAGHPPLSGDFAGRIEPPRVVHPLPGTSLRWPGEEPEDAPFTDALECGLRDLFPGWWTGSSLDVAPFGRPAIGFVCADPRAN